jgi:hypothetical protein
MELSSPVASVVPGLALNAVVTPGAAVWLAAIPIRRMPVLCDSGRRLLAIGVDHGKKAQKQEQGCW